MHINPSLKPRFFMNTRSKAKGQSLRTVEKDKHIKGVYRSGKNCSIFLKPSWLFSFFIFFLSILSIDFFPAFVVFHCVTRAISATGFLWYNFHPRGQQIGLITDFRQLRPTCHAFVISFKNACQLSIDFGKNVLVRIHHHAMRDNCKNIIVSAANSLIIMARSLMY